MGNKKETRQFDHRWKRIKYPLLVAGIRKGVLEFMARMMYGNWEQFCERQFNEHGNRVIEGIVGNNVMMTKKVIDIAGLWDEGQQAADFDLFMRVKKRSLDYGDIKPCHIALGVFIHHFIRMTSKYYKVKPTPFADKDKLIPLSGKWSEEDRERLHPDNITGR